MTLSSVSNATTTKGHISHQNTGTDIKQTETSRPNPSLDKGLSGNNFDDNVTLSKSESNNDSLVVIDKKAAERLLPQTVKSILEHSKTAISAQANTSPQAAQKFLS
jgi:hypothetical protein